MRLPRKAAATATTASSQDSPTMSPAALSNTRDEVQKDNTSFNYIQTGRGGC